MGIRFYCPNGHKLNVKGFQAGRKGICPHCGAKMRIPLESTRPSSRSRKSRSKKGAAGMTATASGKTAAPPGKTTAPPRFSSPPAPTTSTQAASASASVPGVPAPPTGAPAVVARYGAAPLAFDAAPAGPTGTPTGLADPLAEAGDVVWYVRPSSGGQFGPAKTDVMRTWLNEGRVSTDTLVWHEGWPQWQEAGSVFPQLPTEQMMPELEAILSTPISIPGHSQPVKHTEKPHSTKALVVGALVVAAVAVLAGLLVILFFQ